MNSLVTRDDRHSAQILQWADLELLAPTSERTHYVVAPDRSRGETRPLRLLYQPGSTDTLIVVLHGAIDRQKYDLPRFEWLGTLRGRSDHVLYVADSTLQLAQDLQIGWYLGTTESNELDRVVRATQRLQHALDIKRLLFVGGSAGGFASLVATTRVSGSRALAFNPQITVGDYYQRFVERLMELAFPEFDSFAAARAALPGRLSVLDAIPSSAAMTSRALIVQNTGDAFHIENHLNKLAAQLDMPMQSTVTSDGNMEFDLRYFAEGHTMPYQRVLARYIDLSLERWDAERVITADAGAELDEAVHLAGAEAAGEAKKP